MSKRRRDLNEKDEINENLNVIKEPVVVKLVFKKRK